MFAAIKVMAKTNTWSNQRRKRRQRERRTSNQDANPDEMIDCVSSATDVSPSTDPDVGLKRKLEDQAGQDTKQPKIDTIDFDSLECVLKCVIVVKIHISGSAALELQWLCGSLGRDAMHQFCQFIKNRLLP